MAKYKHDKYTVNKLFDTYYEILEVETGFFTKKTEISHHWSVNGMYVGIGVYTDFDSMCQRHFVEFLNQANPYESTFLKKFLTPNVTKVLNHINGLWPYIIHNRTLGPQSTYCSLMLLANYKPFEQHISDSQLYKQVEIYNNTATICTFNDSIEINLKWEETATIKQIVRLYYLLNLYKLTRMNPISFIFNESIIDEAYRKGFIG